MDFNVLRENFITITAMTLDFHDQAMEGISQDRIDHDRWRQRYRPITGQHNIVVMTAHHHFKSRVDAQVEFLIASVQNAMKIRTAL